MRRLRVAMRHTISTPGNTLTVSPDTSHKSPTRGIAARSKAVAWPSRPSLRFICVRRCCRRDLFAFAAPKPAVEINEPIRSDKMRAHTHQSNTVNMYFFKNSTLPGLCVCKSRTGRPPATPFNPQFWIGWECARDVATAFLINLSTPSARST